MVDDAAEIQKVSETWIAAVERGDTSALARLVTDDVVVVHGSGRQIIGRDAVLKDLTDSQRQFAIQQKTTPEETVVAGKWAFQRATVHTKITPRAGGPSKTFESRTLTVLSRSAAGAWQVARVIGVIIQPSS